MKNNNFYSLKDNQIKLNIWTAIVRSSAKEFVKEFKKSTLGKHSIPYFCHQVVT